MLIMLVSFIGLWKFYQFWLFRGMARREALFAPLAEAAHGVMMSLPALVKAGDLEGRAASCRRWLDAMVKWSDADHSGCD